MSDTQLQECDLVMKGGIASGVVYPKAVTGLAKKYRFVNVGGTSAGAIAAAFTAAAEYSRQTDSSGGFDVLDGLPDELGSHLLDLFQPAEPHQKLFRNIIKFLDKKGQSPAWFAIKNYFKIKKSLKAIPDTYYGLCGGLTTPGSSYLGLTDWLNLWIEKTAGRAVNDTDLPDQPLTFGMLGSQGITLRTITTNLSQQAPVNLPAIGHTFIHKNDLAALMPENVVTYIESMQADSEDDDQKNTDLLQIPAGDDMPVLLAVRLSLSFPVLLSAIPLYRNDWSLRKCPDKQKTPMRCWFSDGGITSNFPIHLFDSIFPTRPTFGISLGEFDDCRHDADQNGSPGKNRVYLPMKAGQGMSLAINEIVSLPQFLMSILGSAQNWQDNAQTVLPGYRERVVRLALKKDEGGLNLTMSDNTIRSLALIGELSGDEICTEFNMDEHRWRRLLSAYSAFEKAFEQLDQEFQRAKPQSMRSYLEAYRQSLLSGSPIASSYPPNDLAQFDQLQSRIDAMMQVASTWSNDPLRDNWGGGNMPRPSASIKLVPERFTQ